jgi:tetratricopeptide (TPR) repeat protein
MPKEKIVHIQNQAQIAYSEFPITPDSKITQLTPAQLSVKLGFEYDESLYHEDGIDIRDYIKEGDLSPAGDRPKPEFIEQRIKQPLMGLVICKMADPLGHGVFTTKDIKEGTVICFYSGTVSKPILDDIYTLPLGSSKNINPNHMLSISPKISGGIARFFQSLPYDYAQNVEYLCKNLPQATAKKFNISIDQFDTMVKARNLDLKQFAEELFQGSKDFDDMKSINLTEAASKQMVRSNLTIKRVPYGKTVLSVVVAACDISAYSQIGFSYTKMFKQMKIQPLFFDQQGKVLAGDDIQYILSKEDEAVLKQGMDHYKQAVQYNAAKNYEAAKEFALTAQKEFIQIKSYYSAENAKTFSLLASIYRNKGELYEAVDAIVFSIVIADTIKKPQDQDYQKLTGILDKLEIYYPNLAQLAVRHYKNGHHQLALTLFLGMLPHAPNNIEKATMLYNIASCYEKRGDTDNAREYCNQAIAHPNCPADLARKANDKLANFKQNTSSIKI